MQNIYKEECNKSVSWIAIDFGERRDLPLSLQAAAWRLHLTRKEALAFVNCKLNKNAWQIS